MTSGPRTLLLLPGLLGDAGSLWQQVEDLGRDHRVIAFDYPDTSSVCDQLDALVKALDAHGAERAVLVGQTLGGYLAQAFARAHPGRVEALVLVHAGPPDPRVARRIRRGQAFTRLLPWPVLRLALHRELRKMLAGLEAAGDVSPEQAKVVGSHFRQRFAGFLNKKRVRARYGLLANLHDAGSRDAFPELAGRVLILHSEGNVFARQLAELQSAFPGAVTRSMGRRHNLSLLVKPEESHRHIRAFLDSFPAALRT